MRKSKIASFVLAGMLAFSTVFAGSTVSAQAATVTSGNVTVTMPDMTLYVGDGRSNSLKLTTMFGSQNVTKKAKYSSSKKKVATVSKTGTVKAVKKGSTVISVKYKGKTCKLKINTQNARFGIDQNSLTIKKGQGYTFKAFANDAQVKNTSVKWSTNNKKVVTVDKKGRIKAKKNGKATIKAKTAYGSAKCVVIVSNHQEPAHQHTWVDHTATKQVPRTVHHDAVYEDVTIPAVTQTQEQCLGCKQWFSSLDDIVNHAMKVKMGMESGDPQRCGSVGGVEREVVITPAHTEQKLVKEAYDETVYDTQTYVDYQECTGCHEHRQK